MKRTIDPLLLILLPVQSTPNFPIAVADNCDANEMRVVKERLLLSRGKSSAPNFVSCAIVAINNHMLVDLYYKQLHVHAFV